MINKHYHLMLMSIRIASPTNDTPMRNSFKTSKIILFFDLSFSAIDMYQASLTINKKPDDYQN